MATADTIVALSSGGLPAGVAVIRASGPGASAICREMAGGLVPERHLGLRRIRSPSTGATLDTGLVAWMPGPNSFTGEDCLELHLHGSPAVVRAVLRSLTAISGVRLAQPGEFTRRAFENGRLDLTEVEGLGDLIVAETETQRAQALARLQGGISERVDNWRNRLLDLRAEIEAHLDFSDEGDVPDDLPPGFIRAVEQLRAEVGAAARSVEQGRAVREGIRVVLAGAPNSGKSSLVNALSKSEVAIVTDEAGTTRDTRDVPLELGGHLVVLVDTAGLRETESIAEAEGVRRARQEVSRSDLVLWLRAPDVADADLDQPAGGEVWQIGTKADIGTSAPDALAISVRTGEGVDELLQRLGNFAAERAGGGELVLLSRERDRSALMDCSEHLSRLSADVDHLELAAENLRLAGDSLARLLGRLDPEAVLDRLFLSFCIGK
ncbi:MAG TPA: tRNA uridine-5-carboxymethylaminomethyl(34) synthesis GTPase MnmE [Devosiaceae bacterium]